MKKLILLVFPFAFMNHGSGQDISRKIDELVTSYVNLNKFNGSVLVARQGKILFEKGYGLKNAGHQTLNDQHTIFLIGSLTKEFTAAVILNLAEQKKLSLSDKLSKYYPDFPRGDSITLVNLLTHTSGISDYTHIPDFIKLSVIPTNEQKLLTALKSKSFDFAPGEKFEYSNSGYMLLGLIIQKVTHMPYQKALRELIFIPCHMSHTGFDFTNLRDCDKATGYLKFSAAERTEGPAIDSSEFLGSGDIYSTVGDLYAWHRALQSYRVITRASLTRAYEPFKGPYGFGWELDTLYGKKLVGHGGGMFGFRSKMVRIPEDDLFLVLLSNDSDDPYLQTLSQKLLAILYHRPYALPVKPIPLSEKKLNAYTGIYSIDSIHVIGIRLINGHLFGEAGGKRLEGIPIKNNYFRFMEKEGEETDIEFGMDSNGKANGIKMVRENGAVISAIKVK